MGLVLTHIPGVIQLPETFEIPMQLHSHSTHHRDIQNQLLPQQLQPSSHPLSLLPAPMETFKLLQHHCEKWGFALRSRGKEGKV